MPAAVLLVHAVSIVTTLQVHVVVSAKSENQQRQGVFTLRDARSSFEVGVNNLALNPMVEFLTSVQKKTARHPM